jgi:hypothetical protein
MQGGGDKTVWLFTIAVQSEHLVSKDGRTYMFITDGRIAVSDTFANFHFSLAFYVMRLQAR